MKEILIVAGDPSGDLHGAHLIAALKTQKPDLRVAAVGGPLMREKADEFLEDLASRGVTGFWEPVSQLGFLASLLKRIKTFLAQRHPAAIVTIDYYGFNRRVLAAAQSQNVPAYYYVSPQVWASRPGRIAVLKRLVRRMFVIFPFEAEIYQSAGVPCLFVGHPLLDLLPKAVAKTTLQSPLKIGFLPGSRASEVRRHLPIFLAAMARIRQYFPQIRVDVFAAPGLSDAAYDLSSCPEAQLVRESDYKRRAELDIAFCSSGTATLENALLGIPMVVIYKMSWITYWIARAIVRVSYISMANILAGKLLVPELIQSQATAEGVAQAAKGLLEDPRRYHALSQDLLALRSKLGTAGAAQRAASEILKEIAQV